MSNVQIDILFLVLIKDLIDPKYINIYCIYEVFVWVEECYYLTGRRYLLTPFVNLTTQTGWRTHYEYRVSLVDRIWKDRRT